ncbi:hypothetical protein ACJRO7_033333 [Eucalyptus globulus]|uniref:Pentatricopeptide repeat-containing protein n=1 Tax=Eucalyptus globulus TaxID=34317 RepID=A0ABD3JR27_EUCGL
MLLPLRTARLSRRSFSSSPLSRSDYVRARLDSILSSRAPSPSSLLQSHGLVVTAGHSGNAFVAAKLVSLYASLGRPTCSTRVFDRVEAKDVFLWNSIVKTHFSNGACSRAIEFYSRMRAANELPDQFTIPMVVAACADIGSLNYGMWVHALACKCGLFAGSSAVGSSFVYMYSKCGQMMDASLVFDEIRVRDVVAWTALLIGYVQNGENEKALGSLREMLRLGGLEERPNFRTMEGGFQASGNMGAVSEGRCLHGLAVKSGLLCCEVVKCSALSMYSRCDFPEDAHSSFCEIVDKDVLSWTSVISVYARFGCMAECLSLFLQMQSSGTYPDGIVTSCVLLAFANTISVSEGRTFHGLLIRRNSLLVQDQMVHNALLSMYCKFGLLNVAEKLFATRAHELAKEPWNIMVSGCGKLGMEENCILYFKNMQHLGIECDLDSLVSVISSCSKLGAINLGKSVHCYAIRRSIDGNASFANSLIGFYGRLGNLAVVQRIFSRMKRDTVSWNAVISSYVHNKHYEGAIALFDRMVSEDMKPNSATLVSVLAASANLASSEKGERIHQYLEEEMIETNLPLTTALVHMYAKCGKLDKARELFDLMNERDIISWNVMISGYGMHGHAKSAVEIFQLMENSKVRPNALTFLGLLSACAHAGLVEEGKRLFSRMQHYSIEPNVKHYTCMVDLLSKSGDLQGAEELVLSMPVRPDGGVWGALLSACAIHEKLEVGMRVANRAIQSEPDNDGYYVLLSNMCSSMGRWEEAEMVRKMMKGGGVQKQAAWSAT